MKYFVLIFFLFNPLDCLAKLCQGMTFNIQGLYLCPPEGTDIAYENIAGDSTVTLINEKHGTLMFRVSVKALTDSKPIFPTPNEDKHRVLGNLSASRCVLREYEDKTAMVSGYRLIDGTVLTTEY